MYQELGLYNCWAMYIKLILDQLSFQLSWTDLMQFDWFNFEIEPIKLHNFESNSAEHQKSVISMVQCVYSYIYNQSFETYFDLDIQYIFRRRM